MMVGVEIKRYGIEPKVAQLAKLLGMPKISRAPCCFSACSSE